MEAPDWSLVASGGSSVSSVRNRSREGYSTRYLFELDQISAPRDDVLMEAFEMRLLPQTGTHELSRATPSSRAQGCDCLDKGPPVVAGAGRRRRIEEGSDRISRPHHVVQHPPR